MHMERKNMTDFSHPGEDCKVEPDVNEWLKGVVYTARPGIPFLLQPGHEYRITVASKQKLATRGGFSGFNLSTLRQTCRRVHRLLLRSASNFGCHAKYWSHENHPTKMVLRYGSQPRHRRSA